MDGQDEDRTFVIGKPLAKLANVSGLFQVLLRRHHYLWHRMSLVERELNGMINQHMSEKAGMDFFSA